MPVETLQETIARHSKHGGYVPLDNGKFLFGDGALMQGIPGHGSSIQEPPREEIFRLGAVLEYWRRRTTLAIDMFNQFKRQLLGETLNAPKWRPEVWGKLPDVAGEDALLFLRDLVRREREQLTKAREAYWALPEVAAQRKADAERKRVEAERAEAERETRTRILAITLD